MTPEEQELEQQERRISVVIVSYNRREQLRNCLQALGGAHQILIVDNGSTDASWSLDEEFPGVRFIRLPKNFGLTKALNIGIRAADGAYILLLHDDAVISGDSVTKLADYLEDHQEVGAVCPLLTHNGAPAPQIRPLPTPSDPDPVFHTGKPGSVECVVGAAIMLRTFYLRALRHIDERYGNYGSDIELCAQVRRSNRRLIILAAVTAEHSASPSPMARNAIEGDRAAGTAVYLGKHHGTFAGLLYRFKVGLGALFAFRFKTIMGAFSGVKIDGTS